MKYQLRNDPIVNCLDDGSSYMPHEQMYLNKRTSEWGISDDDPSSKQFTVRSFELSGWWVIIRYAPFKHWYWPTLSLHSFVWSNPSFSLGIYDNPSPKQLTVGSFLNWYFVKSKPFFKVPIDSSYLTKLQCRVWVIC